MYADQRDKLSKVVSKAQFYTELKQFKAAKLLLQNSISEYGETSHVYNQLGLIDYLESAFLDAIEKFKKELEINPDFIEAAYNLMASYCDLSMYDQAKEIETRIHNSIKQSGSPVPGLTLGRIADQHVQTAKSYKKSNLKIEAIREYEKALGIFPDLLEAKYELAKLRISTGQYEQAKELLLKMIREQPDSADYYSLYATAYLKQNKTEDALELLNKALHIDPKHNLSRTLLSSIPS